MGEHSTARASRRRGRPFTRWRNNTRNMAKTFAQAGHPWTENNHMIEITKFSNEKRTSKAFNADDVAEMGIERWILHIEVHIWYILCPTLWLPITDGTTYLQCPTTLKSISYCRMYYHAPYAISKQRRGGLQREAGHTQN